MLNKIIENGKSKLLDIIPFFFETKAKIKVDGIRNTTLLEMAHKNKIELEGACEGSLACSTCHVILDKELFRSLDEPSDKEYDLLDQAYGVTSTSRLGCQIRIDDRLRNKVIRIPRATRNIAVDGFKPKPH